MINCCLIFERKALSGYVDFDTGINTGINTRFNAESNIGIGK